ncbi:flippase [Haloplanus halophilus]|uniref:flippase n=1 Tax=Haloplanus halophilus TaxID=2949993 RepID=UPI00203B041A|nr:flippase [Haloplanus sp. GDY1]
MNRDIFRGIFSVLSGKITILFISLVTTPLIVRLLGPADYGNYSFILSVLSILSILMITSVRTSLRKYLSENIENLEWVTAVFGFFVHLGTILSVIFGGLIVAVVISLRTIGAIESPISEYLLILVLVLFGNQIHGISWSSLMSYNLEHYAEGLNIGKKVIFYSVGIVLLLFGFGVFGLLLAHILAGILTGLFGLLILRNKLDLKQAVFSLSGYSEISIDRMLRYNLTSTVLILLTASLYHTDIILIRGISGSSETGLYKAALQIAQFLWFAPTAIHAVFVHSTSELWADSQVQRITEIASLATRYTLLLSVLLAIGLATLADSLMPIYFGPEFSRSIVPLLVLLPGTVGFAVAKPIYAIGQGNGKLRVLIIATGIASAVNFGLNLILIPRYGILGAAVATSIGYLSMVFLHIMSAQIIGFNPIRDLRFLRIALTSIISGVFIYGLDKLIQGNILSLVIIPPSGFLVFAGLCIITGSVDQTEIQKILRKTYSLK